MDKELYNKALFLLKKTKSVSKLCKELGLSYGEALALISIIKENNNTFDIVGDRVVKKNRPINKNNSYEIECNKDFIKIMFLSDTHLCSKFDDIPLLNKIYDIAEKERIDYVFHAGDLTDGIIDVKNYKSYLKEYTYESQLEYSCMHYPMYSGKTYAISGNHDDKWYKKSGREIIYDISQRRDDIVYLGAVSSLVHVGSLSLQIVHGDLNPITNSDFGITKYVDSLSERVDIIEFGHKHKSLHTTLNNIDCYRCSSLINNPYKNSFGNEKSVYILDVGLDSDCGKVLRYERRSFNK